MNRTEAFFLYFKKIHPDYKTDSKLCIDMFNCWNAAFDFMKYLPLKNSKENLCNSCVNQGDLEDCLKSVVEGEDLIFDDDGKGNRIVVECIMYNK